MAWTQPTIENQIPARGFHSSFVLNHSDNNTALVIFGGSANFDANNHECTTYFNDMYFINANSILNSISPQITIATNSNMETDAMKS
jgi:hypothetical protein